MKVTSSPFFVTVVSGEPAAEGTPNTISRFVNEPGEELYFPGDENWHVALHQIQATNYPLNKDLRLMKVRSNLIAPHYSQKDILAIIPRHEADVSRHRMISVEPENKEYFPIRSEFISEIRIELVDADGNVVQFQPGQPTVVILEFKKMKGPPSYIVRVESQLDPEGTASDFSAAIPPAMNLDPTQKWAVSVNSVSYTGSFEQVPDIESEGNKKMIMKYKYREELEEYLETSVSLPQVTYRSNADLLEAFTAIMAKLVVEAPRDQYLPNFTSVHQNYISGRIIFKSRFHSLLYIPLSWAHILGCPGTPNEDGYVVFPTSEQESMEFAFPMNCNAWIPNTMLIYSNFVEYSPVGSVLAPVLKVMPLESIPEARQYYRYQPTNEEQHPIIFSQLDNLRFQVRRIDGRKIDFKLGSLPNMIISLGFSRQ